MEKLIAVKYDFKNKIWGGRKLETEFGYPIPEGPVGECWAISAHPNGDCVITGSDADGSDCPYTGKTLSWLWAEHRELFGGIEGDQFPLLVKIIDAAEDLSIQVHPDDAYAREHENGSLGKKECWYVLAADEGATIVVGQRAHDRDEFAKMVQEGRWSELLNEIPVKKGDFFQIDPGTVHAIKGGTMVLETQQSSDVTYRVYDYDRKQDDGTLRPLHMAQALDVIDFDAAPITSGELPDNGEAVQVLESNDSYTVERVRVSGELTVATPHPFTCVSVVEADGDLECMVENFHVIRGAHFLALSTCEQITFKGNMEVVLSYL